MKCELQRIQKVFDVINTAISQADDFSYVPYKPRVIEDMEGFMKKGNMESTISKVKYK